MDFADPEDHREKIKENEKRDKYTDIARDLKKKLWNMRVTVILIVIGTLVTIPKDLIKGQLEFGKRVETIQTTAFLRSARILRRVQET